MRKYLYTLLLLYPFFMQGQPPANQDKPAAPANQDKQAAPANKDKPAALAAGKPALLTPFERSKGKQTATYAECIAFYQQLDKLSPFLSIREMGMSDAGYPYHVVLYSNDGVADPAEWHRKQKAVILINNGIHPGEPDGVDASMMLLRDLVTRKFRLPDNTEASTAPLSATPGSSGPELPMQVIQP